MAARLGPSCVLADGGVQRHGAEQETGRQRVTPVPGTPPPMGTCQCVPGVEYGGGEVGLPAQTLVPWGLCPELRPLPLSGTQCSLCPALPVPPTS